MIIRTLRSNRLRTVGLVALFIVSTPLAAFSGELSDAELTKKLKLTNGQEIVRKNGKRYLLTPLDDEAVERLLRMRAAMDKHENLGGGVPALDLRHAASSKLYWSGRELMNSHKYEEAAKLYSQYIDKFIAESKGMKNEKQDEHDYYLAWGYQCRGFCSLQQKMYDQGVKDLTEAIKLRPRYVQNYVNRAKAYRLMGNIKLAEDDEAHIRTLPPMTGQVGVDLAHEFPAPAKVNK